MKRGRAGIGAVELLLERDLDESREVGVGVGVVAWREERLRVQMRGRALDGAARAQRIPSRRPPRSCLGRDAVARLIGGEAPPFALAVEARVREVVAVHAVPALRPAGQVGAHAGLDRGREGHAEAVVDGRDAGDRVAHEVGVDDVGELRLAARRRGPAPRSRAAARRSPP